VTELKIPAQAEFVIVAKRTATAVGSCAGFSLEGIDDLNIAVAQACEKAIAAGDRMWGPGNGVLKLTFGVGEDGIEVEVRNLPAREAAIDEAGARRQAEVEREAYKRTAARLSQAVVAERQERIRAQKAAQRLAQDNRRIAASTAASMAEQPSSAVEYEDVAVNMIRLFVDELRYNVDSRGAMRMRMVKYLVD
jgi:hypothetical protein